MTTFVSEGIDVMSLPSLPISDYRKLPNCMACYFVLEDDVIIYVGRTSRLVYRWSCHQLLGELLNEIGEIKIAWLECSDLPTLVKLESDLIDKLSPRLNNRGKLRNYEARQGYSSKAVIVLHLNPDLKARLQNLATKQNRSLSNMVSKICKDALGNT